MTRTVFLNDMANIMSMKRIRNNPSRNGLDLSQKINFTAKAGEYIPCWWIPVCPADDVRATVRNFIRTQPLNTAAFARMNGYYDFYFVPFSQMWNKFNPAITQMTSNLMHANGPVLADNVALSSQLPYITAQQIAEYITSLGESKNTFGFYRAWLTCRLLEYLGYGLFYPYIVEAAGGEGATWSTRPMLKNLMFSPFPLFAYQKIYADYGRYTQWERTNPATFNCDYISGKGDLNLNLSVDGFKDSFNFLDVRYCNWQRDLLHGTIPQAQYGEASLVPVGGELSVVPSDTGDSLIDNPCFAWNHEDGFVPDGIDGSQSQVPLYATTQNASGGKNIHYLLFGQYKSDSPSASWAMKWANSGLKVSGQSGFNLSILALRRAEAAQKWREIALAAEEDYPAQIQAHWNIEVNKLLSDMCQYIGSVNVNLSINEVVNTNITGSNAADIAGKGTMSGNGGISFRTGGQYGIIMCIFHVLPILDYVTSAPYFGTTLTDVLQFPIPEFDKIGMEEVPVIRGLNPVKPADGDFGVDGNLYFGYAPQYYDWKTCLDRSMGEFRNSLKTWIIPFDDDALLAADSVDFPNNPNVETDSIKAGFFKVSPAVLDNLFGVNADSKLSTDQFLCSNFFDVKVVRNLDVDGLPY